MDKLPDNWQDVRVLVIGDIMLDRYVWGKVHRISPEAPVPVVKAQHQTETLGGAGNVAANLAALNCNVTLISTCGQDPAARQLKEILDQKGIDHFLVVDKSRPTITKTRIMAHKQQALRLDEENTQGLNHDIRKRLWVNIQKEVTRCQAVILSDYGKGMFASETFTQEIINTGRQQALPVLIDPKGLDWQRYHGATCITPNTAEFEALAGVPIEEDQDKLIAIARQVRMRYGLEWLLVTRGAKGMCLINAKDESHLIPAKAREVYDVSGAGDTVIATLAASLATGLLFEEAAKTANLAAGIVVGKLGTKPILHSELVMALQFDTEQQYCPNAAVKTTALDAAAAKVQEWKAAGAKVVFTNGCFDLLHPGHISLFYQARALGDRLIVGLNTDASVQRLKGSGRPILSQQDRAAMLSALECVDIVVHFDEDTPIELIKAVQPDILVKGSDYKPDQVVGKEVVEAYGGCVQLVDLVPGYSTTQITEKILSNAAQAKK